MSDGASDKKDVENGLSPGVPEDAIIAVEDEAILPKGTLDPVYEAKAKVLNRAVS